MLIFTRILSLTALTVFTIISQAAGFNCQKASNFVEKAICQDQNLSALDDQLNSIFNIAISNSKNPEALKKQEFNWLKKTRNVCQTNDCLTKVYLDRIAILAVSATNIPHARSMIDSKVAGTYIRYDEKGKPDYHPASLTISFINQDKVKIVGKSMWIGDPETGNVHTGEVSGVLTADGEMMSYQDENECHFLLTFSKGSLTVNNDNGMCGGVHVGFDGFYKKLK